MGTQDAHNLAWKLASVHHGLASPELLRTYEEGVFRFTVRCNFCRGAVPTRVVSCHWRRLRCGGTSFARRKGSEGPLSALPVPAMLVSWGCGTLTLVTGARYKARVCIPRTT